MATTPAYSLRYQTVEDPPDGASLGQNLAEDVEGELVRIDALVAGLATATDWATYTPSAQNLGSGAFSTQTGWWRRIWAKHVAYTAYFVVSTNGTGTGNFGYKLPTVPFRSSIRQAVGIGTRGDGGRLARFTPITFGSGTDEWVDRILTDSSSVYLQGQDLDAGDIYVFTGEYREA